MTVYAGSDGRKDGSRRCLDQMRCGDLQYRRHRRLLRCTVVNGGVGLKTGSRVAMDEVGMRDEQDRSEAHRRWKEP